MNYIPFVLLLLLSFPGIFCDCDKIDNLAEAQKIEFSNSDLVFVGEVIDSDNFNGTYKFKVIELFKGKVKEGIIKGTSFSSCGLLPQKEDGLWLFYTNELEVGSINIFDCGLSRSFRFPFIFSDETPLPPQFHSHKDKTMSKLQSELAFTEYRNKALLVLKEEIEQLSQWK